MIVDPRLLVTGASASKSLTRSVILIRCFSAFLFATFRHFGSISTAITSVDGSSSFAVIASVPLPVPMSMIVVGSPVFEWFLNCEC